MRVKFRNKILLVFALAFFLRPQASYALSQDVEEKIVALDTKSQKEEFLDLRKLLKSSKMSQDKKARLYDLIERCEKNIDRMIKIQETCKENIRIKNQIRPHLQNRDSYFTVDIGKATSNDSISKIFLEVAKEDDYFYYGQYGSARLDTTYNPNKSKDSKTYIEKANFDVKYRVDIDMEYAVNSFVKDWVSENIDPYLTEYAKVQKIHDFIVKENFYNRGDSKEESGGISIYHPASILYGNGGVCNAYATLFDLMARQAGLKTRLITGKSLGNGEDHMWNMVKVMGSYYHIDTTWDDPIINYREGYVENIGDFVIYDYFLKSDQEILKSRTINESKSRPKATSNFPASPENFRIEEVDGKYFVIN